MISTNKLRFVERSLPRDSRRDDTKTVHILQQWWDNRYYFGDDPDVDKVKGEWRDVPIEQEKDT